MREWRHFHSLAVGGITGVFLAGHSWILLFLGIMLGVVGTVGVRHLRRGLYLSRELVAARIRHEDAAASELAARADHRIRARREQVEAERRAYWQGARDGKL